MFQYHSVINSTIVIFINVIVIEIKYLFIEAKLGLVTSLLHLIIKVHLRLFVNKLRKVEFTITYMTLNCAKEDHGIENPQAVFNS